MRRAIALIRENRKTLPVATASATDATVEGEVMPPDQQRAASSDSAGGQSSPVGEKFNRPAWYAAISLSDRKKLVRQAIQAG